jgi:hypothetical protein
MSAARGKVIGSIIRNTVEMLPMETGGLRTSLAATPVSSRAALAVPEDPVELAVRAALVVSESLAVQVALVVPEDPAV